MTALSANKQREFEYAPRMPREFPVLTNTLIYQGSAVVTEQAVGYARTLAASLTAPMFLGFAQGQANNNPGASGAKNVEVIEEGVILASAVTGATGLVDVGKVVYMSDDDTYTLTSTNNVEIGKIANYVNSAFRIHFRATSLA